MKQKNLDLITNVAKGCGLNDGRKADLHCACVLMKDEKHKQGMSEVRTIEGVVFLLK